MTQAPEVQSAIAGLKAQMNELQSIVKLINVQKAQSGEQGTEANPDVTLSPNAAETADPTSTALETNDLQAEVTRLRTENARLKYRLQHLSQAYDRQAAQLRQA
ncbi:hypothetical protein IWQ62_000635 [Dispira parvispora]|uniref:Uncharacterized protein n=1 Tax=Dispira parvispora TaxID=1520584 RepID=A0A9W8AU23_9FUNG|nr:hypothetical protein IWQ62_000635 [Dispira parvispora]